MNLLSVRCLFFLALVFSLSFTSMVQAVEKRTSLRSNKNASYYVNGQLVGKGKAFETSLNEDENYEIEARVKGYVPKFEYVQAKYHRTKLSFVFLSDDLLPASSDDRSEGRLETDNFGLEQSSLRLEDVRFRALIIANEEYVDPSWPDLNAPVLDANKLKNVLEKDYGFTDTVFIKNADRRELYASFKQLIETTEPTDRIIVFYAGHGHYDSEILNTGYWVPVDAIGQDESTFISNEDIKRRMTLLSRKATNVLLISDSCFSGNFLTRGFKRNKKVEPKLVELSNLKSTQVLSSGGNEYVSDSYGDTQSSPFAHFLLRRLNMNNLNVLRATNLANSLETSVANISGQSPQFGTLQGAENEGGDFVFYKRK